MFYSARAKVSESSSMTLGRPVVAFGRGDLRADLVRFTVLLGGYSASSDEPAVRRDVLACDPSAVGSNEERGDLGNV